MVLTVTTVYRVTCSLCKKTMTYTEEDQIPELCPNCLNGAGAAARNYRSVDDFEEARNQRMRGKKVPGQMTGHFKV